MPDETIRKPTTMERIDLALPENWGLGQLLNALATTAKEMSGYGPSQRVWQQATGQKPFNLPTFIADLANTALAAVPYATAVPKAGQAADAFAAVAGQQLASQAGTADLSTLYNAYATVSKKLGLRHVPIADVLAQSGMTMQEAEPLIRQAMKTGDIVGTEASWTLGEAATPQRIKDATFELKLSSGRTLGRVSDIAFDKPQAPAPPAATIAQAAGTAADPHRIARSLNLEYKGGSAPYPGAKVYHYFNAEIAPGKVTSFPVIGDTISADAVRAKLIDTIKNWQKAGEKVKPEWAKLVEAPKK